MTRRPKTLTIDEARMLAIQLLAALDSPKTQPLTVGELFDRYMESHGMRCKSAVRMRQLFNRHLKHWADRQAVGIMPHEVVAMHNAIGVSVGFATANRVLEILRAAYNRAIKWGLLNANPCLSTSVFPLDSRDRYLSSKTEMTRFLAALATMRSSTFQNFILTCLFTAARVSNVQSMEWSQIDFDLKVWRIPMTKSGKPVLIPLIDEALSAIEAQRGKHRRWVFPGRGKTGHLVNPARAWDRLISKAGIENLRMHDLRRTMGSWEANTGASLQIIQKTLGHSSIRATHIYARLQLDPVRAAMQKATEAMLNR